MLEKLEKLAADMNKCLPILMADERLVGIKHKKLTSLKVAVKTVDYYRQREAKSNWFFRLLSRLISPKRFEALGNVPFRYDAADNEIVIMRDTFESFQMDPDATPITTLKHELGHALDYIQHPVMFTLIALFSARGIGKHLQKITEITNETLEAWVSRYYRFKIESRANAYFGLTYKDLM